MLLQRILAIEVYSGSREWICNGRWRRLDQRLRPRRRNQASVLCFVIHSTFSLQAVYNLIVVGVCKACTASPRNSALFRMYFKLMRSCSRLEYVIVLTLICMIVFTILSKVITKANLSLRLDHVKSRTPCARNAKMVSYVSF